MLRGCIVKLAIHAAIAQLVERIHGKDEVSGSSPDRGSRMLQTSELSPERAIFFLVVRSTSHIFSWGDLYFGSLKATIFLFLSFRFNPNISSKSDFLASWSAPLAILQIETAFQAYFGAVQPIPRCP